MTSCGGTMREFPWLYSVTGMFEGNRATCDHRSDKSEFYTLGNRAVAHGPKGLWSKIWGALQGK